jgi:Asp-tRNA(Asn)/Glu-tRNA(Gln) amidotransferase A subunit family amidase
MTANTAPLNLSGHPALAVPCGFDLDLLPVSMQIVAKPFADAVTFQAAAVVAALVRTPVPA